MGARRQFNREFKVEAVKLITERGEEAAQRPSVAEPTIPTATPWLKPSTARTKLRLSTSEGHGKLVNHGNWQHCKGALLQPRQVAGIHRAYTTSRS